MFFIIAPLIAAGLNLYAYKRFASRLSFLQNFMLYVRLLFILFAIFSIIFLFSLRLYDLPLWLYLLGATCFGASFFFASIALVYDIFVFVLASGTLKDHNPSRRKFIRFVFDVSFIIVAFGFLLRGFFSAISLPKVKNVDVRLKGLKHPLRIALISDVHIGEFLGREFILEIVNKINTLNVDAVFIVGDLLDTPASRAGDMLSPLSDLHSCYGTFFVTGNHEFYHGARDIVRLLSGYGVNVLQNQSVIIGGVNLSGVHDLVATRTDMAPDPKAALSGIDPSLPVLMLAHQPKFIHTLDELGLSEKVDLLLCGHTHAGQIFPFSLLVLLQQPYLHGLYQHSDKTQVYVSSGAGFWGPPVRVLAPSEIVILNLKEDL